MWLCLAVLGLHGSASGHEIPERTILHLRLTSSVSSQTAHSGDPISAVLIAPVAIGTGVLAAGTVLQGVVDEVVRHSVDHQAQLRLEFNHVELVGGVAHVATRVLGVDNARENVDKTGLILGARTQADRAWGRVELLTLALFVPEIFVLDAAGSRILEGVQVDVSYSAGVELDVEMTQPLGLSDTDLQVSVPTPSVPTALQMRVATLPTRTSADEPARPADLINVMFVGSAQELANAFARAGWMTADVLSVRADTKTFLAIASREGYQHGPVSVQTLDGRTPDYVFQKQNNTFAKRHHVRIWRQGSWDGQPLWVGAGTHDIGVKFVVAERSFTHRVDGRIDLERDKIVDDLAFARIPPAGYVDRPAVPQSAQNATQDVIVTDGRLAVMWLPDHK